MVNELELEFTAAGSIHEEAITKLNWEMDTNDSVTTRLNVFLVRKTSKEDATSSQQLWGLMHNNDAAPSLQDATQLLKVKADTPLLLHEV